MLWLKVLHLGITALPWILGIWCRKAWVLLLCIALQMLAMAQWLILGRCILNEIENEGASTESMLIIDISEWMQIPVKEFKDGFVLINSIAPSFLQMSRIAADLGI